MSSLLPQSQKPLPTFVEYRAQAQHHSSWTMTRSGHPWMRRELFPHLHDVRGDTHVCKGKLTSEYRDHKIVDDVDQVLRSNLQTTAYVVDQRLAVPVLAKHLSSGDSAKDTVVWKRENSHYVVQASFVVDATRQNCAHPARFFQHMQSMFSEPIGQMLGFAVLWSASTVVSMRHLETYACKRDSIAAVWASGSAERSRCD